MILKNFIVLEGIDGAGTTTQLQRLKSRKDSERFLFTAEPTPAPTGKFLRQILKGEIPVTPETAAYLFAADRSQHVNGELKTSDQILETGIMRACESGKIVVSDRYLFSSLAYQSPECGEELPKKLNSFFPLPEILFFFDIDPEISLKRVMSRGGQTEIYEKMDFQKKVRDSYNRVIEDYERNPEGMRIVRIDATRSMDEIAETIRSHLPPEPSA